MSRELIDEIIDNITESEQDDFGDLLETVIEYGFADENALCSIFDMDSSELDELVSGSESLTEKQWTKYCLLLSKYLRKIRKNYERLYFSAKRK